MSLNKHYQAREVESRLEEFWRQAGIYHFDRISSKPVYSIDTPPPTVSGNLHLGHIYSYSHTDFVARFKRMQGWNVFYPMGYDDNGLPTEKLVERKLGITAAKIGRNAFIEKCLEVSEQVEGDYQELWQHLGLSIDWRYSYRTIDDRSRKICQLSFLQLARNGRAYQRSAPSIWCPECQTAIAQAELYDLERTSEYVILKFYLDDVSYIPIATTRPELLGACVAIFIHPEDFRWAQYLGKKARVPLYDHQVPILADPGVDQQKGTGIVMCCTFGDAADVSWWLTHHLPLIELVERDGRLNPSAGPYQGMVISEARTAVKQDLALKGYVLDYQNTTQSIRVHERCDTPVEILVTRQWFIKIMDLKQVLLDAGRNIQWHPDHMRDRYENWVENLSWDWCISRQRYYGVPIPVWYCEECRQVILAEERQLPVDPLDDLPGGPCPRCGSLQFRPDVDVFDTWATSSMTPQIVGQWLNNVDLFDQVYPFSLRPQAHEIIRTWAFYTILKSILHFSTLPWDHVAISGWGIAGEGMGKISKSRGGGPMPPLEMIEKYSADAVRYWAASTGPGKDAIISEEKVQMGAKLATKLWNVARFSEPFLVDFQPPVLIPSISPADRWILSRLQGVIERSTGHLNAYDYASAKGEAESFFWSELTDNYLEMCKQRLYGVNHPLGVGARYTLYQVLLNLLKLFSPYLPYITDEIYQKLFRSSDSDQAISIHQAPWPVGYPGWKDDAAEALGAQLVQIAISVRRSKSERKLPLGIGFAQLQLATDLVTLEQQLRAAVGDLMSITRAQEININNLSETKLPYLPVNEHIWLRLDFNSK
jgi:valyl-tRNA synthetase